MGVTDFTSDSTGDYYAYDLQFDTLSSGSFGIKLLPSTLTGGKNAVKNFGVTYFYM